jgi:hypothetical protein
VRANRDNILATVKHIPVIKSSNFDGFVRNNLLASGQITAKEMEDRIAQGKPMPEYKPLEARVILLDGNDETGAFTMTPPPAGLAGELGQALDDLIREQIASSPLPELLSGKMTAGNYASVESHVELTIDFVRSLRREYTKSTDALLKRLQAADPYGTDSERLEWGWDSVELTSAQTRANTLSAWAGAMSTLSSAKVPLELAFETLKGINPGMPYKTAGELREALKEAKNEAAYEIGGEDIGF